MRRPQVLFDKKGDMLWPAWRCLLPDGRTHAHRPPDAPRGVYTAIKAGGTMAA